jgi:ABC-type lipoprotein release transport system permease subunit
MIVYVREFDSWTVLLPKKQTRIPAEVIDAIRAHPAVERVIESRNAVMVIRTLVGKIPYHLRAVRPEEMEWLMQRSGNRLKEGHLPGAGTNEVALHENLMRANGWATGQEFGMDVSDDDWMPGRFKVVGVLEGPTPLALCSFEYLNNPLLYTFSAKLWERLVVVARPGRTDEMNAFVRGLPELRVWDRKRALDEISETFDRLLLIFNFVSFAIIAVVAVVVGMIHNIFFAQRIDEFAILLAIGHTRKRLLRKVTFETVAIMAVSWAAGAAMAFIALELFRSQYLFPRGVPIPLVQAGALGVSLALPGVAFLFAAVTVNGRLRRLDPVTIIERRG